MGVRYEEGGTELLAYGMIKRIFYINPFPEIELNPLTGFYVYVYWYDILSRSEHSAVVVRISGRRGVWPLINAIPTNFFIIPREGDLVLIDDERQFV